MKGVLDMSRCFLVLAGGLFIVGLCLPGGGVRADSCSHDKAAADTVETPKLYRCPTISAEKKESLPLAEDESFMQSRIMKQYIDACGADIDDLKSMSDGELSKRYILYSARKECFE